MDIFLHICCGPCLIYPFRRLKQQGFKIHGFYYNPNIYPVSEYNRRLEGLKVLSQKFSFDLECPQQEESDYLRVIKTPELLTQRCLSCWSLRLHKTALQAKKNGFKTFSTTLLVSPYQNHELLKQLGYQIGQEIGVDFYYEDFRSGFRQAQREAQNLSIYRQKYCGCRYSEMEQCKKIKVP